MTKDTIHNFIKEHVTECKPCAERKEAIRKKIAEWWDKVAHGKEELSVEKATMELEGDGYVDENGEIHMSPARVTRETKE